MLNPQYPVFRDQSTLLSDCFIRPDWLCPHTESASLSIPPASVAQTVQMTHKFSGTATVCNKPNCDMSNVTMAGFDICDDSSGANKAVLTNVVPDCGTNEWVHAGGGGGPRLHGVTADPLLEGSLSSDKQSACYTIVNFRAR